MPSTSFLPPIESWSTWSSLFDDQRLWRPVIDAICDAHGIRYRTIHTPRSNTNAVFLLDRRLILKIYSPFWSEYEVEPRLIEFLRENDAVPVPTIVAAGKYRDRVTWNYLVLESSSGHTLPAIRSEITRADYLAISRQVGLVVRALHDTDVGPLKGLNTGESWDALVDRRRRNALAELTQTQMIAPGVAEELAHTLDHVLANDSRNPQTLVHGDLESDHVLLNRLDGEWRVTCIIDFGDARIGVPNYEWMPLWLGLFDRDIQALRAFLETYDRRLLTDQEFPRRLIAWTLLHDFGADAIARLLRRSNVPTPVQTLTQLREVCWPAPTTPSTT